MSGQLHHVIAASVTAISVDRLQRCDPGSMHGVCAQLRAVLVQFLQGSHVSPQALTGSGAYSTTAPKVD